MIMFWGLSPPHFTTAVTALKWLSECMRAHKIISSRGLRILSAVSQIYIIICCATYNTKASYISSVLELTPDKLCDGHWGTIRLVTQNLSPQESCSFSKLWIIGIDGLIDFKGIKGIGLAIWCFHMDMAQAVGTKNWKVIMYLFWHKHFAAIWILQFFFRIKKIVLLQLSPISPLHAVTF